MPQNSIEYSPSHRNALSKKAEDQVYCNISVTYDVYSHRSFSTYGLQDSQKYDYEENLLNALPNKPVDLNYSFNRQSSPSSYLCS